MFRQLAAFRKKHGHCNVPANCTENLPLGRWVAQQRYKKNVNCLPDVRVEALDSLGFIWSVSGKSWDRMLQLLAEFRKKNGHSHVPTKWSKNPQLADWVQRQRLQKRTGRLSAEREARLTSLGFVWAVYKAELGSDAVEVVPERKAAALPPRPPDERLYHLGNGRYVQYSGKGKPPPELEEYSARHKRELPPYFSLSAGHTVFRLVDLPKLPRIRWNGKSALPKQVLEYVIRNGVLPPHD